MLQKHERPAVRIVRPSADPSANASIQNSPDRWAALGFDLGGIVALVSGVTPTRVEVSGNVEPTGRFDVITEKVPGEEKGDLLRRVRTAVADSFSVSISNEQRPVSVDVLTGTVKSSAPLRNAVWSGFLNVSERRLSGSGISMEELSVALERWTGKIIVDETGAAGQLDFNAVIEEGIEDPLRHLLRRALNLDVISAMRVIDFVIVQPAKQ